MMNSVELSNETIPSQDHGECVKCALSGLTLDTQQHSQLIASLDRIASELPYTADNVRLLCWAVNRARGTMSDAEYVEVCLAVVRCNDYPARE